MKVFVGMSGGVDSSVTAALCKEQGHEVTGVYMKNWTQDVGGMKCSWEEDVADAGSVAAHLGIDFTVFDFETEYRQRVVDYMIAEYRAGRTPNPDIMCNQEVKFKLFLETALQKGADAIATGHYARSLPQGRLLAGTDESKDQSYFLYRVTAEALQKSLFPLGDIAKRDVRRRAADLGLPTANKPDSQGICFIGEVSIKEFLQEYIQTRPGPIRHLATGDVLGEHAGAAFYTIGQRHGLDIGGVVQGQAHKGGLPLYVARKDMATNTLFVTENLTSLMQKALRIHDTHWINRQPEASERYLVRTRHRGRLTPATVQHVEADELSLRLQEPERAVTAGQSAVLYRESPDGLEVVGGGIIMAPDEPEPEGQPPAPDSQS